MADEMMELLTRMYSEFSAFRKDITKKVEDNGRHVHRLENEIITRIEALFDGYKQTYEKISSVEKKIDIIS